MLKSVYRKKCEAITLTHAMVRTMSSPLRRTCLLRIEFEILSNLQDSVYSLSRTLTGRQLDNIVSGVMCFINHL